MDWLVGTFFPANPGSRFVSVRELVSQAAAGDTAAVSRGELRDAAMQVIEADFRGTGEPAAIPPQRAPLLLARRDVRAAGAGVGRGAGGRRQATVHAADGLLGPLAVDDGAQTSGVRVPAAAIAVRDCADLRRTMSAPGLDADPGRNAVPSWVTVGGVRVTAAQFLLAMAEAVRGAGRDGRRRSQGSRRDHARRRDVADDAAADRRRRPLDAQAGAHSFPGVTPSVLHV